MSAVASSRAALSPLNDSIAYETRRAWALIQRTLIFLLEAF
jgi:hypothetical protein